LTPGTAAKLPTKKRQCAPAVKVATAKAAAVTGSANSSAVKKIKGLAHDVASLKKTGSKPARQAGLLAIIKSLLATTSEDPVIQLVLSQLIAGGKVFIDDNGAVRYSL